MTGQARAPEAIMLLTEEADALEAEAALLEHGGDKPDVARIIGPPKPPTE
jgi:hypothetical protein